MRLRKLYRLTESGFSHIVIPIVAVIAVGVVGIWALTGTHAQTLSAPQTGPSPVTTCNTTSNLTVVWAAVGGATKYELLVMGPQAGTKTDQNAITKTYYVVSSKVAGTNGTFKVRAGNTAGWGPWSATKTFSFATSEPFCDTDIWSVSATTKASVKSVKSGGKVTFSSVLTNAGPSGTDAIAYSTRYIWTTSPSLITRKANQPYALENTISGSSYTLAIPKKGGTISTSGALTVKPPATAVKYVCGTLAFSPAASYGAVNGRSTAVCVSITQ